jgi:hypothetical protein
MQGIYADLVLDSSDVCSNCFRQIKVQRIDPTREGFAGTEEFETHYERKKQTTTIEYAPHDIITRSKGVFCQCGCESAYERLWSPTDLEESRLKELLKNILRTLDAKGVTLKTKETAAYVLHCWSETNDVDKSLSKGIEMGVVASAAASSNANQQTEHEVDG